MSVVILMEMTVGGAVVVVERNAGGKELKSSVS